MGEGSSPLPVPQSSASLLVGARPSSSAAERSIAMICCFCGAVNDRKGVHARSCTCGGDFDLRHNAQRDAVFAFCRRGNLRPRLEAAGLLADPGAPDGRRPADVLVCAELGPSTPAERDGASEAGPAWLLEREGASEAGSA